MQFAGEDLREWLANLSHNVNGQSKQPTGIASTTVREDIPVTAGSIDYIPDGPGERAETDAYNEYLDRKVKELRRLEENRWEKEEEEEPDPVDPDPVDPDPVDPVDEIDPERKAAQDKWRKIFAAQIDEGKLSGLSEIESMDRAVSLSRVMTPGENADYRWAFEGTTNAPGWRKWGGGNKQGSGGGSKSISSGQSKGPSGPSSNSNRGTGGQGRQGRGS